MVPFAAIVDNLINRTLAWEEEKKALFLYDGVSSSVNLHNHCRLELFLNKLVPKYDIYLYAYRSEWCRYWRTTS